MRQWNACEREFGLIHRHHCYNPASFPSLFRLFMSDPSAPSSPENTAPDAALAGESGSSAAAVSLDAACRGTSKGTLVAGFAALDLSTGEFRATEFTGEDAERRIWDELEQLKPREVLYASSLPLFEIRARQEGLSKLPWAQTPLED